MSRPSVSVASSRWRPLALFLLTSGALLLVGAVLVRSPVPIYLAIPLLLAAPAAAWAGPRGAPTGTLELRAEGSGTEVRLAGLFRATGRLEARDLTVLVERPPGLLEEGSARIEQGPSSLHFEYSWRAPEPTIAVVNPPRILWKDPLGLVERPVAVAAEPLVVARYPPELLRVGAVRLRRTSVLPGENPSSRIGATGEFHSLRTATSTDPPRVINWRASARAGRLVANEFELDRTGDVLLLLDARGTTLGPAVDERLLGIARAAALGIADSFLHEKTRVGVAVFSEFVQAVPLSTGRGHHLRLREALLSSRVGPAGVPSERGAVSVSRYYPPGVTTILFSSLTDDASAELVLGLRRRGYPVLVLSPSPLPILAEHSPLASEDETLVARLVALTRRARIARSWKDAPTVDWDDYWSLGHFVKLLRHPTMRRVG